MSKTIDCIIDGQVSYVYSFSEYTTTDQVYVGHWANENKHYVYNLKFTTPEFSGTCDSIVFDLRMSTIDVTNFNLRYALCTSNSNYSNYTYTGNEVEDSTQIASGVITLNSTAINTIESRTLTISTNDLLPNTTYFLYLWAYGNNNEYCLGLVDVASSHAVHIPNVDDSLTASERHSFILGWLTARHILNQRKSENLPYKFYNISETAGKYLSKRLNVSEANGQKTFTEYDPGHMPLSFTTYVEGGVGYGTLTQGNNCNNVYFYPNAKAGDFIEICFTFPSYDCDYAEVNGLLNQWIYFYGALTEGWKDAPCTYFGWHQYMTPGKWEVNSAATSSRDRLIGDDLFFEPLLDENGTAIGIHFSGTLLYDANYFYTNATLNYKLDTPAKGNNITTFSSYDDFRYRVVKGGLKK